MLTNVPFGPRSFAHRFVGGPALGALAFDVRDDVAAADALADRPATLEDARQRDVAVDADGEAEAVVAAFLPLAHLRVARGSMKLECGSSVCSMPLMAP